MSTASLTIKPFGATTLLIEWPPAVDEATLRDIMAFDAVVRMAEDVIDTVIAYHSLTIRYAGAIDHEAQAQRWTEVYESRSTPEPAPSTCWHLPVCYDPDCAPDLRELARARGLGVADVIERHTAPSYLVHFIGFQPGFLYLGGLDERLHTPRRSRPRVRVPAGSVGIGGGQTGIYPREGPGGWTLIGRSPIDLFDVTRDPPCFARSGDRVRFRPIDSTTFERIAGKVRAGCYQPTGETV